MNNKNEENESESSSIIDSIISAGVCLGLGVVAGIGSSVAYSNVVNEMKEKENEKKMLEEAKNDPELSKNINELPDYSLISSFLCPITKNIMTDPVITPYGTTYERSEIEESLKTNNSCPLSKKELTKNKRIPSYALKSAILAYKKENPL